MATIVLTIASLITFIPAGFIADKIGRKWTVLIGIALMIVALFMAFIICPIIIGDAGLVGHTEIFDGAEKIIDGPMKFA